MRRAFGFTGFGFGKSLSPPPAGPTLDNSEALAAGSASAGISVVDAGDGFYTASRTGGLSDFGNAAVSNVAIAGDFVLEIDPQTIGNSYIGFSDTKSDGSNGVDIHFLSVQITTASSLGIRLGVNFVGTFAWNGTNVFIERHGTFVRVLHGATYDLARYSVLYTTTDAGGEDAYLFAILYNTGEEHKLRFVARP